MLFLELRELKKRRRYKIKGWQCSKRDLCILSPAAANFFWGRFRQRRHHTRKTLIDPFVNWHLQIAFPARSHHESRARSHHHRRRESRAHPWGPKIVFNPLASLCLTGNWKEHAADRNLRPPSLRQRSHRRLAETARRPRKLTVGINWVPRRYNVLGFTKTTTSLSHH